MAPVPFAKRGVFCLLLRYHYALRRDGRAVECGGLENRWARERLEGSNPSLSAMSSYRRLGPHGLRRLFHAGQGDSNPREGAELREREAFPSVARKGALAPAACAGCRATRRIPLSPP